MKPTKPILKVAAVIVALLFTISANAEYPSPADSRMTVTADTSQSRPVTSTYSLEIGKRHALSTYLSPLSYRGLNIGVSGNWRKALPTNPEHMIMHFNASASFSRLLNPYGNSLMAGIDASFNWGMSYRHVFPSGIQIAGGGDVGIDGGALYLIRNGNNPVSALASTGLALRAYVSKPFRIGNLPMLVSDEVRIPSIGVFFSPGYGETYYEIYLGNHSGLAHCGWWGNNFRIDNLLAVDLDFGRTAMRIGYRLNAYTSWACNLNTHIFTHSFVIGITPGGLGLKKRTPRVPKSTIYAIY